MSALLCEVSLFELLGVFSAVVEQASVWVFEGLNRICGVEAISRVLLCLVIASTPPWRVMLFPCSIDPLGLAHHVWTGHRQS